MNQNQVMVQFFYRILCQMLDWLNEHPFKNEPNASLICNLHNGTPIKDESLWTVHETTEKTDC